MAPAAEITQSSAETLPSGASEQVPVAPASSSGSSSSTALDDKSYAEPEAVSGAREFLVRVPPSFLESGELRLRIVFSDQKQGEPVGESIEELIEQR